MNLSIIKALFFLVLLLTVGCTNYTIPIQTEDHPAFSSSSAFDIELLPIILVDRDSSSRQDGK